MTRTRHLEAEERRLKRKTANLVRRVEARQKNRKALWDEEEEQERERKEKKAKEHEANDATKEAASLHLSMLQDVEAHEEEMRTDLFLEEILEIIVTGQEFRMGLTTAQWLGEWALAEPVKAPRKVAPTHNSLRSLYELSYLEGRLRDNVSASECTSFTSISAERAVVAATEEARLQTRRKEQAAAASVEDIDSQRMQEERELLEAERAYEAITATLGRRVSRAKAAVVLP